MTRSDDPTGDLPEWRERRLLEEMQRQARVSADELQNPDDYLQHQSTHQAGYPGEVAYGEQSAGEYAANGGTDFHQQFASRVADFRDANLPEEGLDQPRYDTSWQPGGGAGDPYGVPDQSYYQSYDQPGGAPEGLAHELQVAQYTQQASGHEVAEAYGGSDRYASPDPQVLEAGVAGQYDDRQPYQAVYDNDGAYPAGDDRQWAHMAQAGSGDIDPLAPAADIPYGAEDEFEFDDDDEYDDYDDEPQRYSWKLMAAVVVTGAVLAGGGVVLYDSLGRAGNSGVGTPIVRADRGPAKTVPKDPGGRKFAHTDSKLLGRLDSAGSESKTAKIDNAGTESSGRVRSVSTVRVGRDGRLIFPKPPEAVKVAETAKAAAGAAAQDAQTSVPGINIVESLTPSTTGSLGGLPPVVPPSAPPQATSVKMPATTPKSLTPTTVNAPRSATVINRAITKSATMPPVPTKSALGTAWRMAHAQQPERSTATTSTATTAATEALRPAVRPPSRPAQASRQTASTVGATAASRTQSRQYVAVLATKRSRMEALKSFVELQQKHPGPLQNRVPSVQKADLSARGLGTMYRVVVGPAGSRSVANSVCSSLKAEGYRGCWIKAN